MKQFVEDLQEIIDKIFEAKINNDKVNNKMNFKRIIVLLEEAKEAALNNRYFCLNMPVNLYAISNGIDYDELYSDLVHIKVKSIYHFTDVVKDFVYNKKFDSIVFRSRQQFLNNLDYHPEIREELINIILAGGIEKYYGDLIEVDGQNVRHFLKKYLNLIDAYYAMFDLMNSNKKSYILNNL